MIKKIISLFKGGKWNSIIDSELKSIKYDEISYEKKQIFNVTKSEVENWLRNGDLSEYTKVMLHKKGLEFFFSAKILDIKIDDIVMDAAGGRSNYLNAIKKNTGANELFLMDQIYKGINESGTKIKIVGGDISSILLHDDSIDKIACHHAFEHFQEDKDIEFIKESYRLLKNNGILVIIPIFITDRYIECWNIESNKKFDANSNIIIDKTASIPGADEDGHFARFYDMNAIRTRIIEPAEKLGFKCEIIECRVDEKPTPDMDLNFGSKLNKPLRALKLQKN